MMATIASETEMLALEVARPLRWSSEEYHGLSEAGFFGERRVELVKGEIVEMGAMDGPHWTACVTTQDALRSVFDVGFVVAMQLPIKLQNGSEPQPDVLVVRGQARDFRNSIPTPSVVALVVEVSASTLRYDRGDKMSLYAEARLDEYWLVDVEARRLEVYRRPIAQADARWGWSYAEKQVYTDTESVAPLAAPQSPVSVQELLP